MQAQATLIGADRRVKLDTPAAVYLNLAAVIYPGYTEIDDAFRLGNALHDAVLLDFGACFYNRFKGFKYLTDSLKEFGLVGIALCKAFVYPAQVSIFQRHTELTSNI